MRIGDYERVVRGYGRMFRGWGLSRTQTPKNAIVFRLGRRSIFHFEPARGLVPQIGHMGGVHKIAPELIADEVLADFRRRIEPFITKDGSGRGKGYPCYPAISVFKLLHRHTRKPILEELNRFISGLR